MTRLANALKTSWPFRSLYRRLNNQFARDDFVAAQIRVLPAGGVILDAGCGNQRYRALCAHLTYRAQDFAQYTTDEKKSLGTDGIGGAGGYRYGALDYTGDIWSIDAPDAAFDAVLCTEVLEHIPYPIETIREFARLLKPGGALILTAPSNCLRHMDPYFFYSGFSDRWFEKILAENGLIPEILEPVGDYYSWLAVELARTAALNSWLAKLAVLPSFLYFMFKNKTEASVNTLCAGYHIVARKT